MQIIIPMAGHGKRFVTEGYTTPKPFIMVKGKPMLQVAVENLRLKGHYIFVMLKEHYKEYGKLMRSFIPKGSTIIKLDKVLNGPAATCLQAEKYINNDKPLFYANCDQYLKWHPDEFLRSMEGFDGGMLMYRDKSDCGSFAVMDESCYVKRTVEKEVISDVSSTGIYYWSKGSDFVKYAKRMIKKKRTAKNGEYYAINIYNEGIEDDKKYVVHFIKRFWRLGVPTELAQFLKEYDYATANT